MKTRRLTVKVEIIDISDDKDASQFQGCLRSYSGVSILARTSPQPSPTAVMKRFGELFSTCGADVLAAAETHALLDPQHPKIRKALGWDI